MTRVRTPQPYDDDQARRDLAWLRELYAIRRHEEPEPGCFVVEGLDRRLYELDAAGVRAFRAGVLSGYRIPRSTDVLA